VLETTRLGFAATSPLGAVALRSLVRHGFRPVLATGRSLAEVRDRCLAWGLAGGVAEYGAVIYDRLRDRARNLLGQPEERALDRLRVELLRTAGVCLDPAYHCSVRAFRFDSGRRRSLGRQAAERAIAAAAAQGILRPVHGEAQTDFAPVSADKGPALRALAEDLGVDARGKPLALAVGDSVSDLGMLRLAEAAYAPANADAAVRRAGVAILGAPCQRGLAAAVTRVIGHAPGGCATCARAPAGSADAELLLCALGALDGGAKDKARQAVRLAVRLARRERWT
jgi:hypothetical protein